jgi:hypothetical protein
VNGWTIIWISWGVLSGAVFLVIEGIALFNRRTQDTLSEQFWRWLHVDDPRPTLLVWFARVSLILFLAWLALHLTLGWFTPSDPLPI